MTEKCYRLADYSGTAECRGEETRDALLAYGYTVVAEIDCNSGTVTGSADERYVTQGQAEYAAFNELPEAEQRELRRRVGGVLTQAPGQLIPWERRSK